MGFDEEEEVRLRPCPDCGGGSPILRSESIDFLSGYKEQFWVECSDCAMHTDIGEEEEVIAEWNEL